MRAVRPGDHLGVERSGVVRAQERGGTGFGERQVEQRLVPLALHELGLAPTGPDRLPDAPDPPAGGRAPVHELTPRRYQARRVESDLAHVGEMDLARVACELRSEQLDLGLVDDHHDVIAGSERGLDEREDAGHELIVTVVEKRLVAERLLRECGAHTAGDRCEPMSQAWPAE